MQCVVVCQLFNTKVVKMSGGYFDYKQYAMIEIAEAIGNNIAACSSLSDRTLETMKDAYKQIGITHIYAQHVDWMISGDDSQEGMQQSLEADLKDFEEEFKNKNWTE